MNHLTPSYRYTQDPSLAHHWRQAVGILAKRGARFVPIRKGSKLPEAKGWNRTENTLCAADALAHLAAGGNVSNAAGTGNVYEFDFDAGAERGYECAQLDGGFTVARANAPHKAKFFFTCDELVPTRPRSKQHGFDLLGINANGTHAQGVIAGLHPSGEPYRWSGHTLPHLHIDTVAALYAEWTDGEELFPARVTTVTPDATCADADLARVADALRYVDPNAIDYLQWQGILAALHDAYGDAALDLAVEWADGKPGEVEKKWGSWDRAYNGKPATLATVWYLARAGGWPDTWLQDQLAAYRTWLASPDAIEDLKAAGFKNPEKARKLLDAILQRSEEARRLRIAPGYANLAKQSTISLAGLGAYLARLFDGGFLEVVPGERKPDGTYAASAFELVFHNLKRFPSGGEPFQVVKNWNSYREFRPDELFINNHAVYIATRTQADLAPLGDNGLGILLALLDGPATTTEAAELVGYSYQATARALRRYVEHGLVDVAAGARNRKTYTLKAEWRAILQANRSKTTTYGVLNDRRLKAVEGRIKYLRASGEAAKADALEPERAQLFKLLKQIKDEAGIVPYHPARTDKEAERRRRLTHAVVVGERALHRTPYRQPTAAGRWRRKEYAKDRATVEANWEELNAWATCEHGEGWWTHMDQTDVLGQWKVYQILGDRVPTAHYDGAAVTA